MLSIDGAIAKHRKIVETQKMLYDACTLKEHNSHFLQYAEEHEQLAEWLEELKALREEKSDFQIYAKDIAEANYEFGMEIGYEKAIDDAKSVILQTLDNEILVDTLHLRLEQLKERNNENYNKEES